MNQVDIIKEIEYMVKREIKQFGEELFLMTETSDPTFNKKLLDNIKQCYEKRGIE